MLQPNPAMAIISLPKHELAERRAKGPELAGHRKLPIGINRRVYMTHNKLKYV
jgi:hypothetical protein